MLDKLIKEAFRIHIEPFKTVEHAAKVDTVVKVLSDIGQSYNNFLEIEFFKNPDFVKVYETNNKVLETIKEDLSLLIVDLDFGSFEAALAPNLTQVHSPFFKDEVLEWKNEIFDSYKEEIIEGDFDNYNYMSKIGKRYNPEERIKIYKPLFSSFGTGSEYKINLKDNNKKITRTLRQPKNNRQFFVPKVIKEKEKLPEYSTIQVFAKVKREDGNKESIKINTKTLKEILYLEELEHDTYPYKTDLIRFDGKIYVLNKKIEAKVDFEDDNYLITNNDLDIVVWGDTRKEAEEAFAFSFYSMYINYCLEEDENLSNEAISLKKYLKELVKSVVNEA